MAFGLEGYSFVEWLKRNKDDLKLAITILSGLVTFIITNYLSVAWQISLTGLVTVGTRLVIDGIDYFFKE